MFLGSVLVTWWFFRLDFCVAFLPRCCRYAVAIAALLLPCCCYVDFAYLLLHLGVRLIPCRSLSMGRRRASGNAAAEPARAMPPLAAGAERRPLLLCPPLGRNPLCCEAGAALPVFMAHLAERLAERARHEPTLCARAQQLLLRSPAEHVERVDLLGPDLGGMRHRPEGGEGQATGLRCRPLRRAYHYRSNHMATKW